MDFITLLLDAELDANKAEMVNNGIESNEPFNGHAVGSHNEKIGRKDDTVISMLNAKLKKKWKINKILNVVTIDFCRK